jgi:Haem-binding domain
MPPGLKKVVAIGAAAGVAGFLILQVFPAGKLGVHVEDIGTNPPERYDLGAPPEVTAIMRRACYDCHTNETKWPLYARLAPGSWLMARDVHNGRNHLNFSNWADADEDERQTDRENAWEHIESGDMPPWFYIYPLHPRAKLSDSDKATLKAWLMKDADPNKAKGKAKESGGTKKDG